MPRYTADSKQRVRDAADIVEIVSARTELRRSGASSHTGLCPFHDERSPSFSLEENAKVYYCFGCQASGDVFTFVQETEGVDFVGALELLAERYGVQLEHEGVEDPAEVARRRRAERTRELLGRTCDYYQRILWESPEAGRAREYLASRGLQDEALRQFRVGYAPSAWDRVLVQSLRAGFAERELHDAGLAQRSRDGRPYDRFRERIMFPLADMRRGDVVGFGARAMRDNQQPKYINTADSAVYHKGHHLYGADLARAHVMRAGRVILCEGYTDVIAMHQAGLRETVGLMGTAMTVEQVRALPAGAATVLLALDADSAGQEAMLRAAAAAAREGRELRVVQLPPGSDPADLLACEGAQAMREAVDRAVAFARFRVQRVLDAADDGSPEGRDRMLDALRAEFRTLRAGAVRDELMRVVSGRLGLREGVTESLLGGMGSARASGHAAAPPAAGSPGSSGAGRPGSSAGRRPGSSGGGRPGAAGAERPDRDAESPASSSAGGRANRPAAALDRRGQTERAFLALCLAMPEDGMRALASLNPQEHFTSDVVRRAARHLLDHAEAPATTVPDSDRELIALMAELTVRARTAPGDRHALKVESLQLELGRIERAIQTARADGRPEVAPLGARRAAVKQELDTAYDQVLEQSPRT